MPDEPLTPGEVAANILNDSARIETLICAWVDKEGLWTWYKLGSTTTVIGICEVLKARYVEECMPCHDDDDEEK